MNQIASHSSSVGTTGKTFPACLVLVVDDSRAHRRLLVKTLSKWGYSTIEAEDGEQALSLCSTTTVDIIVSDWMMPGMSGVQFCQEFRALYSDAATYFILLTAQTEKAVLAEGLESGADDFLSKPFNSVELRARLQAGKRVVSAQRDMVSKNQELRSTLNELSAAYAAIDRDLAEAQKFQEALVPERYIPLGETDISMLFQPSGHVGGDLVGYFLVDESTVGVYSVDVSGHGVCSALMTARIASYLCSATPERNIALESRRDAYVMIPPEQVCHRLNDLLQAEEDSDQYLTMSIARFDLKTGTVELAQAGHPSPMVQKKDGSLEFLEMFSMPIGLIDNPEFASTSFTLQEGERLLLYSDGITECSGISEDEMLDEAGLVRLVTPLANMQGPHYVSALVEGLAAFAGNNDFQDDLSAVLIERVTKDSVLKTSGRHRSQPTLSPPQG